MISTVFGLLANKELAINNSNTEPDDAMVIHWTRIPEAPSTNPRTDNLTGIFSWFLSAMKPNAGLDFHYHDSIDITHQVHKS